MSKIAKVLLAVGSFIALVAATVASIFRAIARGSGSLDPFELDEKREKEVERIKAEIKLDSDEALANRFNELAKKEEGKR